MRLRVGHRVPLTRAEGPGARAAFWTRGCSIRCPGCCNPHLFDPAGGHDVEVAELLGELEATLPHIEGITLLGGEPFDQDAAAAELAQGARARGLSVMTFTGYRLEDLTGARLLSHTDVLVDGRYEAEQPETERRWVGSRNQRFHYLTARYDARIERPAPGEPLRTVEISLGPDGVVRANGWPALTSLSPSRARK